ncbi:MAG: ABC transporter substrate-binding protein [Bacilli bacterium]|nr:ABC transporter substrate-binding protein [Bacilli bacterium]MDD3305111.1 ABC transporter substrate-binding protein [Bacilli bacterium]MDD4053356.1 ABC transporter substrate-binding protein [Bacilli bacterium]MDD4410997.1 ABC transporter substrate-binding protein [Bacilli bacterium]
MKKIIISLGVLIVIMLCGSAIIYKGNKESDLTKIKLAEVTHSVFYAPQYVALSEGYFEEENLDVELILTPGADKVAAAVLSGDVQIGFSGPEATLYVYNSGEKDYMVTFAGLTKRDGSFLVSREKIENFTLNDLKGKYVIGGRKGGMPEMTFEWALKQNGINPKTDLKIDTSIAFAAMQGAFIGGTGDFVTLFEPVALQLEKEGYGYVVASIGELGGEVPYTAYNARKSYIEDNPKVIEGFTKAINKGLTFVHEKSNEEIANSIYKFFPDLTLNELVSVTKRYKDQDAWLKTTNFTEQSFNHLQEIMISAGELNKKTPFEDLVNNSFSK